MEDIRTQFSEALAKKILGNATNATQYLFLLREAKNLPDLLFRTVSRGKKKGENIFLGEDIWKAVVDTWDYEASKDVIRRLFQSTEKYQKGITAKDSLARLLAEWNELGYGVVSWPFSPQVFDAFVQNINSQDIPRDEKDEKMREAAVKYRRIKEINTLRNDFIETLIFRKNENVIPTLSHRRGIDFFINGIAFDQKVSRSTTQQFQRDFGASWRAKAKSNPELVAQYLYKHQDAERFDFQPRLFLVYLDESVSPERIEEVISPINLNTPLEVTFSYEHVISGSQEYTTQCFVILLDN